MTVLRTVVDSVRLSGGSRPRFLSARGLARHLEAHREASPSPLSATTAALIVRDWECPPGAPFTSGERRQLRLAVAHVDRCTGDEHRRLTRLPWRLAKVSVVDGTVVADKGRDAARTVGDVVLLPEDLAERWPPDSPAHQRELVALLARQRVLVFHHHFPHLTAILLRQFGFELRPPSPSRWMDPRVDDGGEGGWAPGRLAEARRRSQSPPDHVPPACHTDPLALLSHMVAHRFLHGDGDEPPGHAHPFTEATREWCWRYLLHTQ